MNFIIETNWINNPIRRGINKHHQSLEQACGSIDGAEFIGLYKPLNDPWNWTHFMKVDTLEKWRKIDKEILRLYPEFEDDVSNSMSRIYWGLEMKRWPPPIMDPLSMKYLVMDLSIWQDSILGIEYYHERCEQFEGMEGAGLLGLYLPLTDNWNWALIKMFDSMRTWLEAGIEYNRTHRGFPEMILHIQRAYERYEP